jgi:rRNA processing protein Gar1
MTCDIGGRLVIDAALDKIGVFGDLLGRQPLLQVYVKVNPVGL